MRRAAAAGVDKVIDHYLREGGAPLALRFVAGLEKAYRHLRLFPATGALRYAAELDMEGLRFWPLDVFPYLVFYFERTDHVDVIAVLHAQRDVPASLR